MSDDHKGGILTIIFILLVSSCASTDRFVNRVIDGNDALIEVKARESAHNELVPIQEAQKVMSFRLDLLTKESAKHAQNMREFTDIYKKYFKTSNDFYISTGRRVRKIEKKLTALQTQVKELTN